MRTRRLKQDLFIILITSFIVIVCWIGFNIYNHWATSTIDEVLREQIAPITGSFDTATIDRLNRRTKVAPLYRLEIVTPTPTPSEFDAFLSADEEENDLLPPTPTGTQSGALQGTIQTTGTPIPTPTVTSEEEIIDGESVGEVLLDE